MVIAETILFLGILALCYGFFGGALIFLDIVDVSDYQGTDHIEPYQATALDYLPLFIGSLIGIWVVHQLIFKRSWSFSGFGRTEWHTQLLIGFILSFILIGLGFLILFLTGILSIQSVLFDGKLFFGFLLFFLVQASVEEFMLRSFLLPTIATRFSIVTGILFSSLVFTVLHAWNPNVSWISLVNIFLAGIMLGALYIKYGQIWAPIGLHVGWNFFQGSFFGFEVSGLGVYSLINVEVHGNEFITGGSFGLEGSLISTIMMVLVTYWIWRSSPRLFKGRYLSSLTESLT